MPKELYDLRHIKHADRVEVLADSDTIVLQKQETSCVFCGNRNNVVQVHDKLVCEPCKQEIQTLTNARYN